MAEAMVEDVAAVVEDTEDMEDTKRMRSPKTTQHHMTKMLIKNFFY